MKLQDQVCSLELAKRLKHLGLNQESHFWWCGESECPETVQDGEDRYCHSCMLAGETYSAFTVAELGEFLKPAGEHFKVFSSGDKPGYFAAYYRGGIGRGETMADAAASLLIHLLENNLITPHKDTV